MPRVRDEFGTLIEEGETFLKEGLRGARHILRQSAVRSASGDPVSRGVSGLARKVDGVLGIAERTAFSILRPGASQPSVAALVTGFPAILGEDDDVALARSLVETQYRLGRAVLDHWGMSEAFLSEQAIRGVVQDFLGQDRATLAAVRLSWRDGDAGERNRAATDLAASLALSLSRRRDAVRLIGLSLPLPFPAAAARQSEAAPAFLEASPSVPTFLAVGLALSGYAERSDETGRPEEFLASAAAIVEGRLDRMARAGEPAALAAEFRAVIPAMP